MNRNVSLPKRAAVIEQNRSIHDAQRMRNRLLGTWKALDQLAVRNVVPTLMYSRQYSSDGKAHISQANEQQHYKIPGAAKSLYQVYLAANSPVWHWLPIRKHGLKGKSGLAGNGLVHQASDTTLGDTHP